MGVRGATADAGGKRKFPAGVKKDGHDRAKKAKLDSPKKPILKKVAETSSEEDDSSDGSSDSEDGGAKLETSLPVRKTPQKPENGKSSNGDNNLTSREAHQRQKQLAQERKAAKPLADEVHRTKKIWEKVRRKSHIAKEERQALVAELYEIITGRVKDFVLKHDAVRAVQTAIKYSTREQRKQIAKELQGSYAVLAENRYAKFLIGKLLVQNDDEIRDIIVPEFYGKVRKLINHPEAAWILDDIYRGVATKEQKAVMLREWYGPEFVLFRGGAASEGTAELSQILENEPSKRSSIMQYLFGMVNQLVQKKLTGFTMLHDAMLQYFLNLKPESEEMKEFVDVAKDDDNGDLLKNMAFTKSGARLVCLLLARGTAKDRRQIVKTFKDTFQLMSGDPYGHVVILTAYDVIDDTVMTSKAIFPEVLGKSEEDVHNIIFCANDLNARKTICYLFEGPSKALFPPGNTADLDILKEVHEIRETTSKKDPELRRKELVAGLSPQLLAAIAAAPTDLISTSFGCQFVADVLLSAVGDKEQALTAIAAAAAGDPDQVAPEDVYPPPAPHISTTTHGGRMFKSLIAGGRFDKELGKVKPIDPPLKFADMLYPVIKDHIVAWATGPSSFTVLGLLEAEDFSSAKELRKTLSKNKKALEKAASEETPIQRAMREEIEKSESKEGDTGAKGEKARKGKKSRPKKDVVVGNAGSRLLLEKLSG